MPATNWQEKIDPGEPERFERYALELREMQRRNARGGAPSRALHAKGQIGVRAEFAVLPDPPEHARVGPFAKLRRADHDPPWPGDHDRLAHNGACAVV